MARRRLLKSYFYVEYNGQKYLNGGTATVPPFEATGGTDSFTVHSSKAWEINNKPSWITLGKTEGKRGSTLVGLTAATNTTSDQRTGELHVGLKCFLDRRNINIDLSQQAIGSAYIVVNFANNRVNSDVTTNTFTLNCQEINMSTLGFYAPESDGILSCNMANSSVTFAENDGYEDRTITLAISGLSTVGQFVSGSATFTQSKKVVEPSLAIVYTGTGESASGGTTNAFVLTKNYITAITRYAVTPNTASVTNTGQTGVTVQFPANQTDNSKTYTVSVSGTDVYGVVKTGSTTFTQSADTYTLRLNPTAYTAASTDVQYSYAIVSSNVSNIGISGYDGVITGASINGNNVVVAFEQNQTQSAKNGTVTITGKTIGGRTVTATATLAQSAAGAITLNIVYDGSGLTPASGSTSSFTITAINVTVTGYSANNGASVSNTGTSTVTLNYPVNQTEAQKSYTVKVLGKDSFNNDVSASCVVEQVADSYSFYVTPSANTIAWNATEAKFTTSQTNVTNVGYYAPDSQNIDSCSKNGNVYTAAVSENSTSSQKTIKFVASGKTRGDRTVYASGTTTQEGKPDGGTLSVAIDSARNVGYTAGTAYFVVSWTNLKVGELITFTNSNLTSYSPTSVTITSANQASGNQTITTTYGENGGSSRRLALSAYSTDQVNVAVSGADYYTQAALPSAGSISVTPDGGSIEFGATSVTFTVAWTGLSAGSQITMVVSSAITTQPSAINVGNNTTSSATVTVSVSENPDNTIRNASLTATGYDNRSDARTDSGYFVQAAKPSVGSISVTPDGGQIGSGATSVTFTVAWSGLSAGSQIVMAVSSAITSQPSTINVGNNTTSSTTVSVNVSANPGTTSRNAILSASGIDNLSSARTDAGYYTQNGKQVTYTLTFVMPQTGDTLSCGLNGASQSVVATNATSYTITGLVAGDTVAYTMTKAGYVSATSSITMGNSDETLTLNLFTNDFHFAVTPGISPDLNNNLFKVTFLADNLFIGDAVLTGNSENSGLGQYHFTLPNNYVMNGFGQNSGDFTYQIEYLTGGINIVSAYVAAIEVGQSTTASSLSEANAFMGNMGILKAKFIRLAYYGTYPSGNFSVTPDAGSIDSATTGAVFTITYQNLAAPSIITVQAGTNVTGLSETQIQVSTTGQATTTVTAYCTTNQSQSRRAIQIEASGTSMVGPILHDGGTYYQEAAEPIPAGSIEWNSSAITVPAFSGNDGTSSFMHDLHFTQSNIDVSTIGVYITSGSSFISLDDLRESYSVATFEIQPNGEDRDRRTGIVWVSGMGLDNLAYSSRCEVTQESGVTPYIAILSGGVWQHGGYTINLPASGEFNYTEFDLDWDYLNPDSIGVSASGGNITDWQEVPSTNMHEIEIRLTANTTTSQAQSYITFTGTSVYGDPVSATLRIVQEGQAIPTTTFYWDYSIHFAGTHGSRVNTEFRIMSGSQIICAVTIDEEELDTTTVDDIFSGTTQITIPTSLYNNVNVDYYTYDTSNHRYIGANLNTEKRNGRLVTTLDVPSLERIQLQLIVQAFNDSRAPFFFAFSAQSVDHVDQMPVQGYDTGVTQLRIITGLVPSAGTVSESANTSQYTGASIYPYYTRMGYELEIVVDTASTSAFTTLKAVVEDSRHNLDELTVVGSGNKYRVYLGGTGENFNGGTIFLKFINTDVPQTPTLTITPSTKTVNADATATTFTVTWSNIPGGSVNLTASSVGGSPSFSPNSAQTATTLAGSSGSRQITLYFSKVSPGGSQRTYDVTATAGGLSDSIEITQTGSATLSYHTSPLTLEGNAGNTYYVESVTIKTYDGVRNNEISWAVNHTVDSNGYTAPYNNCTIDYNGITTSATRISLVMTEITVLLNGNGDRPNTVQLTVKGMTGQSGSRPTNSYYLQADSQNRYKFIIPTNLPSESVGDVLLGQFDDFPASPEINIFIK